MAKMVRGKKYLTLLEAAARLDVPRMTLYRWARDAKTANGDRLEVVKDAMTHQYYLSENSVVELLERYGHGEERLRAVVSAGDDPVETGRLDDESAPEEREPAREVFA